MDKRLLRIYAAELMATIGANLMVAGIFFYTSAHFGWGARRNLPLAAGQGAVYVIGALAADGISRRFGRHGLLAGLSACLAVLALAALALPTPLVVAAIVLTYTLLHAAQWPPLESLVSADTGAHNLSRRIAVYNLVWSGGGAVTSALIGTILARLPAWAFFALPAAGHVAAWGLMFGLKDSPQAAETPHAEPKPELLAMRTLAMRLSRIALPATMAVIYSLVALMPTLPVIGHYRPEMGTLLASVWMMARFLTFIVLGATAWWHTRPRLLLAASLVLPISFLAITNFARLDAMIAFQILLGVALGLIYASSLYFGMVLSSGSTEHGGYHEALIGLGVLLGPGSGALAQWFAPTRPSAGVAAIALVLFGSAFIATLLSALTPRKKPAAKPLPRPGALTQS